MMHPSFQIEANSASGRVEDLTPRRQAAKEKQLAVNGKQ
jgi:hypothetical protein